MVRLGGLGPATAVGINLKKLVAVRLPLQNEHGQKRAVWPPLQMAKSD